MEKVREAQVRRDSRRRKAAKAMERIRTMRTSLLALAMAAAIFAGCRNNNSSTTSPAMPAAGNAAVTASATTLSPEQLGEIGASIHKHPNEGTKILSDHGLTEAQFEKAIRQVSSDPAASKRYATAYKRNT